MTPQEIEALLARLNFEKIHLYMVAVGWGYGFENVVPSIEQLQEAAREVLQSVATCERPNSMSSTGGFLACKWTWDDSIEYEINFVIEDASDIRRK